MGILFRRKESIRGNQKYSTEHDKYKVRDSDFNKMDAKVVAEKMSFRDSNTKREFEKFLDKAQSGGVEWKEVHGELQELVGRGKISRDDARKMSEHLGMINNEQRKFQSLDEYKRYQKKNMPAEEKTKHWLHGTHEQDKDKDKKKANPGIGKDGKVAPTGNSSPRIAVGGARYDELSSAPVETQAKDGHNSDYDGPKSLTTMIREHLLGTNKDN